MDTADAAGDLFFDLMETFMYPLNCPYGPSTGGPFCANAEVTAPDLVVTKLTMEVDTTRFGSYALCNICTNGTDHFGHSCPDDSYFCFNGSPGTVGFFNVSKQYQTPKSLAQCKETSLDFRCWEAKLGFKMTQEHPGVWYSTEKNSMCADDQQVGDSSGCAWKTVSVDKVVNASCQTDHFVSGVELHGTADDQACFTGCGGTPGVSRNISDPCWVRCFYAAVLGPDSNVTGGPVAGIPLVNLVDMWADAIADKTSACPDVRANFPNVLASDLTAATGAPSDVGVRTDLLLLLRCRDGDEMPSTLATRQTTNAVV
eukprot:CAMPEP_0195521354 /NCGR_PEP_ID=MMETSP0794_2-20130614/18531_1 /TAXON_ID=515487 /ORGANISM="Stephanopyxis turris, Strain CCMP 815" /LENGTH=313 /DNA_ID=CAMNT_0040650891 /DNA_START=129 /DNA_END=1071 /DNA_ORIENTATION=+